MAWSSCTRYLSNRWGNLGSLVPAQKDIATLWGESQQFVCSQGAQHVLLLPGARGSALLVGYFGFSTWVPRSAFCLVRAAGMCRRRLCLCFACTCVYTQEFGGASN